MQEQESKELPKRTKERKAMMKYKLWLLTHDAGTLVHISSEGLFIGDIQGRFPEYEVSELKHATTEDTFKLHIRTDVQVHLS